MLQRHKATELPNLRYTWESLPVTSSDCYCWWYVKCHKAAFKLFVCCLTKCVSFMSKVQSSICLYATFSQFVPKTWSKAEVAFQTCVVGLIWITIAGTLVYKFLKSNFYVFLLKSVALSYRDPWKCLLSSHYTVRMKERLWKACH